MNAIVLVNNNFLHAIENVILWESFLFFHLLEMEHLISYLMNIRSNLETKYSKMERNIVEHESNRRVSSEPID